MSLLPACSPYRVLLTPSYAKLPPTDWATIAAGHRLARDTPPSREGWPASVGRTSSRFSSV
jgi:hypothetical protein